MASPASRRGYTARMSLALMITAVSVLASGCSSGGTGAAQGTSTANAQRNDVARIYWRLYTSVPGDSVIKVGGNGNFVPCSVPAGTTIRYGVEAPFQARTAAGKGTRFARALEQDFSRAGYPLTASAGGTLSARRGSVRVTFKLLGTGSSGPMASLTLVTGCFDAGSAASKILQHYGGATSDQYRDAQAPASPMPTGFPWDSGGQ